MVGDDDGLTIIDYRFSIFDSEMKTEDTGDEMTGEALCVPMESFTRGIVFSHDREIDKRQGVDDEQHHNGEVQETEDRSPVHIQIAEEQCPDAQESVEDRDACEVTCRYEMAYPFAFRRVIDTDGNGYQRNVMPSGKDQQFEFRFVPTGEYRQSVQLIQRIDSHTGLRVRQVDGGL